MKRAYSEPALLTLVAPGAGHHRGREPRPHPFLPGPAQGVRFHNEASLTHLTHSEQPTVNRRYGFYMELRDVASGEMLMTPHSLIEVSSVKSLSRLDVERLHRRSA